MVLGVNQSTICKYETGRLPAAATLKKIADYGGVTVEWLLSREAPDLPPADESITIESPARASILSMPTIYGAIDINAMTQIIEALEQFLAKRKKPLKPVKKALLLSLLYDDWQATGRIPDETTVKEFLRRVD